MRETVEDERREGIVEDNSAYNSVDVGLSRRDFLKLGTLSVLGLFISRSSTSVESELPVSMLVHGIEVFGLQKKISTSKEADGLSLSFDLDFERKLSKKMRSANIWEQRETLLPKSSRYVEVVVTQSVYKNFMDRKEETGYDYVEWAKLHVDLMNREIQQSRPKSGIKIEISRIIVVDDEFKTNPISYSKDVDAIWFDNSDCWLERGSAKRVGYLWSAIRLGNGEVLFGFPARSGIKSKKFDFPRSDDSFDHLTREIIINQGLIHEWFHLITNFPDEYIFDVSNSIFKFKNFRFSTGDLTEPVLSGYLATLLRKFEKKGIRGYYTDLNGIGSGITMREKYYHFEEIPEKFLFDLEGCSGTEYYRTDFDKADYYANKTFRKVTNSRDLFTPQKIGNEELFPTNVLIKTKYKGTEKELYVPLSIINMAGFENKRDVTMKIEFTGFESPYPRETQIMELVENDRLSEFLENKRMTIDPVYAKMKITGTNYWAVWSFRD